MKLINDEVTLKVGENEFKGPVSYHEVENLDDIMSLLQEEKSLKKTISNINYATNLRARAIVRQTLLNTAAGPAKAIEKMVKQYMDARMAVGKPVTLEKAQEWAKKQLESED